MGLEVATLKLSFLVFLILLAWATPARGDECTSPSKCVPKEDMDDFVKVLREKRCLQTEKPSFKLDPITIVVDTDGRIYTSGANPNPYHLQMTWCGYTADGSGDVKVQAAMREPPEWGFRFRPKASLGYLPAEALAKSWQDGIEGGVLLEPFFWRSLNLNAQVGFRSVGLGLGMDLTRNFGVYLGYALTWGSWRSSPQGALWFSFW